MKTRLPLLLSLLVAVSAQGQQPQPQPTPPATGPVEPPELVQLRQQFALRALSASKTLAEQYTTALSALSKDAGTDGDYEQALASQRIRQELADLYARSLDDPTLSNVVVLKPADARLSGAVVFDRALGELVNWRTVGSVASWEVQKTIPGKYNITVTYSVAPMGELPNRVSIYTAVDDLSTGGEFEFYEDSSLAGASMNRRAGQVGDTGGWDKPAYLQLAPITLTRASGRFALKITRTRGSGGVMRLKEVRLTPVKEGDTPTPAPDTDTPDGIAASVATAVDELGKIRETHLARIQSIIKPLVDAYSGKVTALAERAQAKSEEETASELLAESQNVQKLVEDPSRISTSGTATLPSTSLRGQGFKEWEGAHYVSSLNNTGDRFLVSYEGEVIPVKLLWVNCPPTSGEPAAEIKACLTYFNLTPEDVNLLGKQARVFTDAFLQDKPLKILTKGAKDAQGHLLVAVQPEGVGDFAGVLVDNGLASVNAPTARAKGARRFEEITLNALKEREVQAKGRTIPPGAWALTPEKEALSSN